VTKPKPAAPAAAPDPVMMELDRLARLHAEARTALDQEREAIAERVRAIKREHHPRLKGLAANLIATRDVLSSAIDANRDRFRKPKTAIMHALSIGLRKQPDKLVFDAAAVLLLIKEHLPGKVALLIDVVERPVVAAIRQLDPDERALIGVVEEPGADVVSIKPVDSSVDKWIDAIVRAVDTESDEAPA